MSNKNKDDKGMHRISFESVPSLLSSLDRVYPARPPKIEDPERLVWMKAGARELIEKLLYLYEHENEQHKPTVVM